MTIEYLNPTPPTPLVFDASVDAMWCGAPEYDDGVWTLTTVGPESRRLLSPNVLEGDADLSVRCTLRISDPPAGEKIAIATLAGVVVEQIGGYLSWEWPGLDGQLNDRLSEVVVLKPGEWITLSVEAQMRDDSTGSLVLSVWDDDDEFVIGRVDAATTWSLADPRSWLVGALNIRPDDAEGQFTVEFSKMKVTRLDV